MGGQSSCRAALLRLQISAGQFQLEMGHSRASLALAEQLLPSCTLLAWKMISSGTVALRSHPSAAGRPCGSHSAFQEALALAEGLRVPRYRAEALIGLGMIASGEGRYANAQDYYQQGLALCQAVDYRPWSPRILTNLGVNYSRQAHRARRNPT